MKRYCFTVGLLLLLLLALAGCRAGSEVGAVIEEGAGDAGDGAPTPTREGPTRAAPTPEPAATNVEDAPDAVAQLIVEDLAQRLERPAEEIQIVSVEAIEWPNAGLGCPLPNVDYAQVTTPGFVIILRAGEASYEYHTDEAQRFVLCDEGGRPVLPTFPVEPGEIQDGDPWLPVDPPTSEDAGD